MSAASAPGSGSRGAAPPWRLPPPVSAVVSRLPQLVPSIALAAALGVATGRLLDRDALARLEGRIVRLVVRDAGLTLSLRCSGSRFHPALGSARADVTVAACAHDFLLLAARREDPDTLFFSRRLAMEGDTELGLVVKNMLDAADLSSVAPWLDRAEALAGTLRKLLPL